MPHPVPRLLVPFCLFALAGCAGGGQAAAPQACTVTKEAEAPLGIEAGFVTTAATIDGRPATMLVDTGSERTLVTPAAVATLRLERDPHAQTTIHGTGGDVTSRNARLPSFGIGGMEMLDQSYAVGDLPGQASAGFDAAGLLGADWLADFDVDLDLPHRRLALYSVQGCDSDPPPWPGAGAPVASFRYGRGIVLVKVALDGVPVTAVLDSGASRSVVADGAAAQAGVGPDMLEHDPSGHSMGVDGRALPIHLHRFATLAVGADQDRGMRLVVGRLQTAPGAGMLLGLDWLRTHRVWIAYRDHRLYVQPRATGG